MRLRVATHGRTHRRVRIRLAPTCGYPPAAAPVGIALSPPAAPPPRRRGRPQRPRGSRLPAGGGSRRRPAARRRRAEPPSALLPPPSSHRPLACLARRKAGERAGGRRPPGTLRSPRTRRVLSALASVCLCAPGSRPSKRIHPHKMSKNACNRGAHRQVSGAGVVGRRPAPTRTPRGSPTPRCSSPRGRGPQAAGRRLRSPCSKIVYAAAACSVRRGRRRRANRARAPGSQGGPTPATGRSGASDRRVRLRGRHLRVRMRGSGRVGGEGSCNSASAHCQRMHSGTLARRDSSASTINCQGGHVVWRRVARWWSRTACAARCSR